MADKVQKAVTRICASFENDRTRLLDIVNAVQREFHCVPGTALESIAKSTGAKRVEVQGVVSFYAFLSEKPKGKIIIRLCSDIIDKMQGGDEVGEALSAELGIKFGEVSSDGKFSLEHTPCIGMCDQAPSAMVNDVIITRLDPGAVRQMVRELKKHEDPKRLIKACGDGSNAHPLVRSMVNNNIRQRGGVIFADFAPESGLKKALAMNPAEVIRAVKTARLRGRGGAGFPTGMKWEFTRAAPGSLKTIICNADEGEPGTFKDRVLLTECPQLVFEGMTIGGYAIGAQEGILYLRAEYEYLRAWLEEALAQRRKQALLGSNILGQVGFNFDIRIQNGAGAYVCGEETALISSCEGLRGDPKNRPPFPAQKGYLGRPTAVNNVETFCCAARILDQGPGWFSSYGNEKSSGTKLLSISGDCLQPGVYEVPFGVTLREVLQMAQAKDPLAVQVGGASGIMVPPQDFERSICFEDLATGGAIMVFGQGRNLLKVAEAFMEFFVEESCGFCTPCRVGNVLLLKKLREIMEGHGELSDIDYLLNLSEAIKASSRCGLGQTSPNPVISTIKNFRHLYDAVLKDRKDGLQPAFDMKASLTEAEILSGRKSLHC